MSKEKSPAFQFYPKEFLTDGNVAGMSLQERGAYITLLCICWQDGSLPTDAQRIANMVGTPLKAFLRFWPSVRACFQEQDGRLVHLRLEAEREKQRTHRQRASDNGTRGAAKRWQTDSQAIARPSPSHSQAIANASQNHSSPVSYLQIPPNPPRGAVGDLPDGWGEQFFEGIKAVYAKARQGATYVPKEARDAPVAAQLVQSYRPLERLLTMYEYFLVKEAFKPKNVPGTIGQFAHMAPQCDAELRAHGR